MKTEITEINEIMSGLKSWDFSALGTGSDTRQHVQYNWNDIYMNVNDYLYHTEVAIIVTSWYHHLRWLKATLSSYRKSGHYVILSMDTVYNIWEQDLSTEQKMLQMLPRPVHHLLAHNVVFKHKTFDADKRTGWYWDVKYAQALINMFPNIKYVYCTNGDCIIEKPDGFAQLLEILGDNDLMSGQSDGRIIHTADVLYKKEAFNKIMDYMTERNKVPIMGGQSPECLLKDAVVTLGLKEKIAPKQPLKADGSIDYYCTQNLDSTWKDILGFRNLYAQHEYCENNGLEPLPSHYFDNFHDWVYLSETDRRTIGKYYDTGDRRYLMMWWDMGDDSWYNRLHHPVEYYGAEPIYDKNIKYNVNLNYNK